MTETLGLRERRKVRTREAIIAAARTLFAERGYQDTTLQDIADAAEVSVRTIFGYFAGKDDIIFSDFARTEEVLELALQTRPAGQDTLDTVRTLILAWASADPNDEDARLQRLVATDPNLRDRKNARIAQLEHVIAPALSNDVGLPVSDPRIRLAAASVAAAFNILSDIAALESTITPRSLDRLIDYLRGGLETIKPKPRTRRRSQVD